MSYAVRFEEVTKRYLRGGPRYRSLRHDASEGFRRMGQRLKGKRPTPKGTLALEDISFEVKHGESFAIIGPNGAGKTTALKLISRISYPTSGTVRARGRVAALIEVGSGVHPELNARENIWLYGQILGMSKSQIKRRFDDIVDFAELHDVLERPVKMYSSGMQLRLGFSIAAHLEPDIFLVDEALAVGDAGFQAKCVDRMTQLVAEGHTLLFVSHNLAAVESICERGLLLIGGKVEYEGTSRDTLQRYLEWVEDQRQNLIGSRARGGFLRVVDATCHALDGEERYRFEPGEGLEIKLTFECDEPLESPYVTIAISDGRPGVLVSCSMLTDGKAPEKVGTKWQTTCRIDELPLQPRLYQVYTTVHGPHGHGKFLRKSQVTAFRVMAPEMEGPVGIVKAMMAGAVIVPYSWQVEESLEG